jgi:hypothetical protein
MPTKAPAKRQPSPTHLDRFLYRRKRWLRLGNWDATGVVVGPSGQHNFDVDGIIGNIQAGFNWRFNRNWLVGVEADYQWSAEKDDFSWIFPITIGDSRSGFTIRNEMKFPSSEVLFFASGKSRGPGNVFE